MANNKAFPNISQEAWKLINQVDGIRGQWIGGAQLNHQALGRLKRSTLITSSGASTRIEGAKLADEDVEKLMRGLSITKFADRDKQEVRGYYELLENVFNSWRHIPFTESTIKHWHKELLKYVAKDAGHRGEYKKSENRVEMFDADGKSLGVIFETTPAYLTPKQMQESVSWTQQALKDTEAHALVVIATFIVEFLSIHPFYDGNGRLARILTNFLMLKSGYAYVPYVSHEKLIEDRKVEYYLALRKSQAAMKKNQDDTGAWNDFFLTVAVAQAQQAIELLSRENIEKLLSPKQLIVWQYVEQVGEVSPAEIADVTGVARPTVSQALDVLLRLKKVERIGQGRTTRYRKV